jgi:peptidoglycan/xylan/chitin deacetylase (PgdA/CDA1 family)
MGSGKRPACSGRLYGKEIGNIKKRNRHRYGYNFEWTVEKGCLTLKLDMGMGFAYDCKISGSTLTLTNDDGESVRYKREWK